ncbi:MAG: hypothetical protein HYX26_09875, partial [Acidobacteriales bacterium]|nr:hypothetical protein [Terriglobales bacterium]
MTTATVTDASGTRSLVTNYYDQGTPSMVYNVPLHDTANYGQGFAYRGNV